MIKHIVMWKLKEEALGKTKKENLIEMKKRLEDLPNYIEEIIELEVGVDFNQSARAFDLVLYSTFKDKEALQAYQIHPEHKKVVAFVPTIVEESKVVDYVI